MKTKKVVTKGCITYYRDGKRHRLDGPAVIANGFSEWWQNGELHRVGGPAIESSVCTDKFWYKHGKLHRMDGPASILLDDPQWFIHGKRMTFERFCIESNLPDIDIVAFKLKYAI